MMNSLKCNGNIKTKLLYSIDIITNPGLVDQDLIEKYTRMWLLLGHGHSVQAIADPSGPLQRQIILIQKCLVGEGIIKDLVSITAISRPRNQIAVYLQFLCPEIAGSSQSLGPEMAVFSQFLGPVLSLDT